VPLKSLFDRPNRIIRFMLEEGVGGGGGDPKRTKSLQIDPADFVAFGILFLAIAAAFVACVIALGLVLGKVSERVAAEIIIACVGGGAISGIVSKLLVRKSRTGR
jgi:hypothetical protein